MKTLGNIIWHIPFLGFIFALLYAIGGLLFCITVIGIPIGLGLLQFSQFLLSPFSKAMITRKDFEMINGKKQGDFMKGFSFIIRILYFPFGLIAAIGAICTIVAEFISIIGIPSALVWAKSLSTIFNPINKICVSKAVADQIEAIKNRQTVDQYSSEQINTNSLSDEIIPPHNAPTQVMMERVEGKTDEELKEIIRMKEDYNPALVQAAETVLLSRNRWMLGNNAASTNNPKAPVQQVQCEGQVRAESNFVNAQSSQTFTNPPETPPSRTITVSKQGNSKIVAAVVVVLLIVGGVLGYISWYMPYVKDRDALRTYVLANNVFLRSSEMAGVEYNILGKVPYGSELITYTEGREWASVKVNGVEGYVSSLYLLIQSDFALLNGVWGDMDAKDCIESSKCRLAVLDFFKRNQLASGTAGWQIYTRTKNQKPNAVFYPRLFNKNSKFTDFVFIVKDNASGSRMLACYSFEDETEAPIYRFAASVPAEGYIKSVTPSYGGARILFDTSEAVNISF